MKLHYIFFWKASPLLVLEDDLDDFLKAYLCTFNIPLAPSSKVLQDQKATGKMKS